MDCNQWYFKYQTKKECEDANILDVTQSEEVDRTIIGSEEKPTGFETTVPSSSATRMVTISTEEDLVTDFDFDDSSESMSMSIVESLPTTSLEPVSTEEQADILNVQIETQDMKIHVKKKKRVDGEVLSVVICIEIGAITIVTCLLYFGMKLFGQWWRRPSGQNYNLVMAERSHLALHQNQAENPEETIRPRIEEDDTSDSEADQPAGYSTAIENTQLTNSTALGLSPIGPFPNRTMSLTGLDTEQPATRTEPRATSGPIPFNMDQELEEDENLDASRLLQQPSLRTVNAIVHDQPGEPVRVEEPVQVEEPDQVEEPNQIEEPDPEETGRRYPLRRRTAPERFGNPVNQ